MNDERAKQMQTEKKTNSNTDKNRANILWQNPNI